MILTFMNTVSGVKVKDHSGKTIATIKKESICSPAKLISSNKQVIYYAAIVDEEVAPKHWNRADIRKYVLYKKDSPIITAKLVFARDAGQLSLVEAPQVESLVLDTPFGEWEAARQKDFSVLISDHTEIIGKISPFYRICPQTLVCADKYPAIIWAGLFTLINYMMQEDDLVISS